MSSMNKPGHTACYVHGGLLDSISHTKHVLSEKHCIFLRPAGPLCIRLDRDLSSPNNNKSSHYYFIAVYSTLDRNRILPHRPGSSQEMASQSETAAKSSLAQRLDLQQRYTETKQRLSQGVRELDLPQRYHESKKQLSESVQKLDLDQKMSHSKERIKAMNLEQRLDNARKGIGGATTRLAGTLQKLNLGKLIDRMEQDQGVADNLERRNRDLRHEQEARDMMREAGAACTHAIESHLETFLNTHSEATYEEWISDLHPENVHEGKLLEGMGKELDHRFYVAESDHRLLWNRNLGGVRREVPPRSQMWKQQQQPSMDFLGQSSDYESGIDNMLGSRGNDDLLGFSDTPKGNNNSITTETSANNDWCGISASPPSPQGDDLLVDVLIESSKDDLLLGFSTESSKDDLLVDFSASAEPSKKDSTMPDEALLWFQAP